MNNILDGLVKVANLFVSATRNKIREVNAPRNIGEAMRIQSPKMSGATSASVDVTISLNDAPAAAAFEWGSGIHSTRGNKEKYPIPKEPTGVAIPVSRWPKFKPPPDVDVLVFAQIEHPGVAPRPYLTPAAQEILPQAKQMLGQFLKAQIMIGVNKIEVIE